MYLEYGYDYKHYYWGTLHIEKRYSRSQLIFHEFKGLVHFMFQVENHIAIASENLCNHNKKWGLYERWKIISDCL